MNNKIIGYGSFFHRTDLDHLPLRSNSFLKEYTLFYAGRYALKYVFDALTAAQDIRYIWLPAFYCPFVKDWLQTGYANLKFYDIDPFSASALVNWDLFSTKDIVLVNNYWGIKQNKIPQGERPLIVEDHSHGWLSPGCIESEADVCIASLRKTIPTPLGGIAWKPKKSKLDLKLPPITDKGNASPMLQAWDLVVSAMEKKASCSREADKAEFLACYAKGENLLRETQELIPLHGNHAKKVEEALFKDYNRSKRENLRFVTPLIESNSFFELLGNGHETPFGLLLIFKDYHRLTGLKQHLISKSIYPAELWPKNNIPYEYKFLLNLHVDFRYGPDDMEYLAAALNAWSIKENEHDL